MRGKFPSNIFLPKNTIFGHWVEEGQITKQKYFQNDYFCGVQTEILHKSICPLFLHFTL